MKNFFMKFKNPLLLILVIILSILLRKIINIPSFVILLISFRIAFLTKLEEYKVSNQMGFFAGLLVFSLLAISQLEGGLFKNFSFPNIFATGETWKFIFIGIVLGFAFSFIASNFKNAVLSGIVTFLLTFIGAINFYLHLLFKNIQQISLVISISLLLGITIFILFLPNKMKYFRDLVGL